ncbi:MAG: phage portal protein [Desulfofustis sp.]|jgi:lambda family phage portal protein|nr:phage portal protein [Desulfofustis sp.]
MGAAVRRADEAGRAGLRTRVYDAWTGLVGGLLGLVSPLAAGRYRVGREMLRGYVSGSATGADQQFRPRLRSADADVKAGARLTMARCRDQYQNNSLIAGGVERMCTNVVRKGIYPQFLFRTREHKLDRTVNGAWETMFRRWALYCDITGHDSYGSLQFLGLRHMWFDGEYLVHRVWDDSLPGVVPLRLELIECQQLDRFVDGELSNGNVARRGVEYDKRTGRPVFYHVLDNHPGDYLARGRRASARRIPAADIIHVWDREMISQYSGIAWLHAVVMEGYRMDEFRHITQDTARAQAIFAYFLKSQFPNFTLGPGIPAGGQATPYTPAATGGAADATLELNAPMVQRLPSGTEVQAISPSHPGDTYEPFVKDSQRWQSAGLGMSFEAFANNYTDASYASARSGALEERLSYQGQQQFLEEKMNRRVVGWFVEAAWLAGMSPAPMPGYAEDPLRWHELACGQMPGWTWVDPNNDANAAEKRINLVIDTRTDQAAERGQVFDDIVERQMDEEEKLIKLAELRARRKRLEEGHADAAIES